MTRPSKHLIVRPAEIRALASPVRTEIVSLMENRGVLSVREMAAHLGMATESLYYHVNALAKLGLLVETGRRAGTTRPEALYALCADRVYVDWENRKPAYRAALKKAVRIAHRLSERVTQAAVDDAACPMNSPDAGARFQQECVFLDEERLRQLMDKLLEIDRFLAEHQDPKAEHAYVITVAVAPRS